MVQNLNEIFNFTIHQFPYIVLFILLITVIYFTLTEKRKRKLVLTTSGEGKRLDDLVATGKLSQDDADKLLKASDPLPEVHEEFPLPDIHLRLTSAVTKIFSIFKVMLITSRVGLIAILPLLSEKTGNEEFNYHSENGGLVLFSILFILITILSIVHFRSSMLITRGRTKAAVWVACIWFFDLLFLRLVLLGANNSIFLIFALLCGFYTMWTLIWRKKAHSFISNSATPVKSRIKLLTLIIFLGFMYHGIFIMSTTYNSQFSSQTSNIQIRFNSYSPHSRIRLIHLIQATRGESTRNFTVSLLAQLKDKMPTIKFTTSECGNYSTESTNLAGGLVLVVSDVKLRKDRPHSTIFKNFSEEISGLKNFELKDIGKESHTFTIQSFVPERLYNYNYKLFRKIYPVFIEHQPELSCSIAQNYSGDSKTALDKLSIEVAENISKRLNPHNKKARFNAPDYLAASPELLELPNLSIFKKGKCIGRFHSIYYSNYSLIQFPLTGEKLQKDEIINELKSQNWTIESDEEYNNSYKIIAKIEGAPLRLSILLKVPIERQTDYLGDMETYSPYGYAVIYKLKAPEFSPESIERFKREDIKSFSACQGINLIERRDMIAYLDHLLSDKSLTFDDLYKVYTEIKYLPYMIHEKDYKTLIDKRMLHLVMEDINNGNPQLAHIDKVIDVLMEQNKPGKLQPLLPYFNKEKLTYDAKSKAHRLKKTVSNFSQKKLTVIDLSESASLESKRRFLFSIKKDGKKVLFRDMGSFEGGSSSSFNESTGKNIYNYKGKYISGGLSEPKLSDHALNDKFVVGIYYDYAKDELTLEAVEPIAKKQIATRELPVTIIEPDLEKNDIKLDLVPTYSNKAYSHYKTYKFRPFEPRSIHISIDPEVQHKYLKESMLELHFSPFSTVDGGVIGAKLAKDTNSFADKKVATFYLAYGNNTFLPNTEGVHTLNLIINAKQRNKPDLHGSWRLPEIQHIIEVPDGEEKAYKFIVESGASSFLEHPYGVRPLKSDVDGPWNRKPAYEPLIKLVEDYDCPMLKQDIYRHCLNVFSYDDQHHGKYFKVDKHNVIKVMCRIDAQKTLERVEKRLKYCLSKGKKIDIENAKWWKETLCSEIELLSDKLKVLK